MKILLALNMFIKRGELNLIRVEAVIKLLKCATLGNKDIQTGFRITMKVGNKGYYTQLFSIDGQTIPLDKETNVYMDVVFGELDIEEFLNRTSFEFVSWEKLGEGKIIDVKDVRVDEDALKEVTIDRKKEIMKIIKELDKRCI